MNIRAAIVIGVFAAAVALAVCARAIHLAMDSRTRTNRLRLAG